MSDMTLKQALSIVSEAGHLRAEMWDAAYNEGTVLYGSDVLDCFEESSKDEANAMGRTLHEAVRVINLFRDNFKMLIDECDMGED